MKGYATLLQFTDHAYTRAAQRNISEDDALFIVQFGEKVPNTGVIFFQLKEHCLPDDLGGNDRLRRLVGSTVVTSSCGTVVITLYRNERAFKRDRSKSKYQWKRIADDYGDAA